MKDIEMTHTCVLPISIEKDFTTNLFHTLPLCVLRTFSGCDEWVCENYVNIRLIYSGYPFYINQFGKSLVYSYDLFQYEAIPTGIRVEGITSLIEEKLTSTGMYAYIMMDEFYLSCKSAYKTRHFYHDSLIYGCDTVKKEFLALTLGDKELIEPVRYSYQEVSGAYYGFVDCNNGPGESIIFFKANPLKPALSFSFENYLNNLIHYANGVCYENRKALFTGELNISKPPYGIHVHSTLSELLHRKQEWDFNDFKSFHFLYEHKAGLMRSFQLLCDNGYTDSEMTDYIIRYHEICNDMKSLRMVALKQLHKKDTDTKHRLCDGLIELEKKEQAILIELTEYLKRFQLDIRNIPVSPISLKGIDETINFADFASVSEVKQADTAEYDYHTVFKLSWKEQMPVRQIHFIGRGIIHVLADNKPVASANVLAEDNEQIRYVYLYNICSELTLDVYSNQPIDYKSLKLQIIRGSLTYGRRAIASSCWPENSHLFTPDQALDYFDTFWNAQPDFPSEEYLEVDLGSEYKINHIVVKERPDVHRIREYKIEGMNCAGELVLLTEFQGDMNREAITHIIPDIYINRLRLTILKTETDNYGFSEPGISRFEAYYCPCLL